MCAWKRCKVPCNFLPLHLFPLLDAPPAGTTEYCLWWQWSMAARTTQVINRITSICWGLSIHVFFTASIVYRKSGIGTVLSEKLQYLCIRVVIYQLKPSGLKQPCFQSQRRIA